MPKKLLSGFALALSAIVFAVVPVAAQAEGTHWYKNATEIREGTKVPTISWGNLKLESAGGTVTCKNVVGGYVENPTGGGPGIAVTQNWTWYECTLTECPTETRVESIINNLGNANAKVGFVGQVKEENAKAEQGTWLDTTGLEVVVGCWTAAPTGPGNVSTTERGTPTTFPLLPFIGGQEPKLERGSTAAHPGKTVFNKTGGMINSLVGEGKWTGSRDSLGYTEQELINVGPL